MAHEQQLARMAAIASAYAGGQPVDVSQFDLPSAPPSSVIEGVGNKADPDGSIYDNVVAQSPNLSRADKGKQYSRRLREASPELSEREANGLAEQKVIQEEGREEPNRLVSGLAAIGEATPLGAVGVKPLAETFGRMQATEVDPNAVPERHVRRMEELAAGGDPQAIQWLADYRKAQAAAIATQRPTNLWGTTASEIPGAAWDYLNRINPF